MTRTLLALTDKPSATQHISFIQPLAQESPNDAVRLVLASGKEAGRTPAEHLAFWEQHQPTTLVLSRYSGDSAMPLLKLARERSVPSIFHIDDDLLDVPLSLGKDKYDYYHQPQRLANLRAALNASDLVYTSTSELGRRLTAHGIRTPVYSGALYCTAPTDQLTVHAPASKPVIGYMGTGGHSQDLASVLPALTRLMDELPDLRFETFGTVSPPAEMARYGARYLHHPGIADYDDFLAGLCNLGWWVGIAPLEGNPFNRCKADTKWVEYTIAGLAVVASDLPVYHRASSDGTGMLAGSDVEWADSLRRLVCDGVQRQRMVQAAQRKLRSSYTRSLLRQQLMEVIEAAKVQHSERAGLAISQVGSPPGRTESAASSANEALK